MASHFNPETRPCPRSSVFAERAVCNAYVQIDLRVRCIAHLTVTYVRVRSRWFRQSSSSTADGFIPAQERLRTCRKHCSPFCANVIRQLCRRSGGSLGRSSDLSRVITPTATRSTPLSSTLPVNNGGPQAEGWGSWGREKTSPRLLQFSRLNWLRSNSHMQFVQRQSKARLLVIPRQPRRASGAAGRTASH